MAEPLVGVTVYQRNALNDDIPQQANCMTAVRYLLKGVKLHLPRVWVGDLPAALNHREWRVVSISNNGLKPGDLLFVTWQGEITHFAVAINANKIFHCAFKRGAVMESREDFLRSYPSLFRSAKHLTSKRDLY